MVVSLGDGVSLMLNAGFGSSNCLFIEGDRGVLVETGGGKALAEIEPDSVDLIINTHRHIDHIKGNGLFSRAKVCVHARERPAMSDVDLVAASGGWARLMEGGFQDYMKEFPVAPTDLYTHRPVDDTLSDGEVIDCGRTRIEVLHTPGHTAGHCSVFLPEEEVLFAGDICLTAAGPCYADPDADIDELMGSIDRLIAIKPRVLVSSHSKKVTNGDSEIVLTEFRDRVLKREDRVLSAIKKRPSDIHTLADMRLIYAMHPSHFVVFWEKCMLEKHLVRLEKAGLAEVSGDGVWYAV
ncbi:MBL fold hydrolase [Desulfoluna limicola]|uniref:MBL fold hydrolase n=1 Tax=Desulfoluna limicola TaxID=2810562 RepID=A0ABM7PHL2_9BACT|nr:MBL fold metallo-hydrolase [Desulfoluna limicola]BCS97067.1 MBL fold hydrolase [Desulfoluna limicola]